MEGMEMQEALTASVPIWKKYFLTPDEAAEYTGITAAFFRYAGNLSKTGDYDLPCVWIGTHLKINRIMLENWLADKTDGRMDFKTAFLVKTVEEKQARKGRPRRVR